MLSFALVLLLIDTIITFYIMKTFLETLSGLPDTYFKAKIMEFIMHPATAFGINLVISKIIGYFTGAGLIAGLANLGSSILVGALIPIVMGKWYNPEEIRAKVRSDKEAKERRKNMKRAV